MNTKNESGKKDGDIISRITIFSLDQCRKVDALEREHFGLTRRQLRKRAQGRGGFPDTHQTVRKPKKVSGKEWQRAMYQHAKQGRMPDHTGLMKGISSFPGSERTNVVSYFAGYKMKGMVIS